MKIKELGIPGKWQISLAVTAGLVALVWLVSTTLAQEPGTDLQFSPGGGSATEMFAYQGYLEEGGLPANGVYDFRFSVWDQAVGGTQYGSTMEFDSLLTVENGVFTAYLYPAPLNQVFTGGPRWLKIEVRPGASVGVYTDLGRQPIVPAPYAWGLRPRAMVSGDTGTSGSFGTAVLNVDNTRALSGGGTSSAVYARATTGSAIKAESGGVAVYGYSPWTYAIQGVSGQGTAGWFLSNDGYGVYAEARGNDHWDHGGYFSADMGYGVYGVSEQNYGMRGEGFVGVRGDGQQMGVHGWSSNGTGVRGASSSGYGVYGSSQTDIAIVGVQSGYSESDLGGFYRPGGLFGGRNGVVGITREDFGYGAFGWDKSTNGGWAGYFESQNGNGLYVSTPAGHIGLQVAGGTKNAVVRTTEDSRLLYSEESTEVWFSDYGFGQLQGGLAVVPIDPLYAQTVNLAEPYHVFVQLYGDAEVYVANRTPEQFEVRLRDGDGGAEFSYRIVAKRLGYEGDRLEPAPWADADPNLYPERQPAVGGLQQSGGAP
jgi:hypothetical protein